MKSDEIAARYSKVPGYTLIDVAEVALPIWSIEIDALVIAKKTIPITDEFLLRSIEAGLDTVPELTGFLGLTERFVNKRLTGLISTDCLRVKPSSINKPSILYLTARGIESLNSLKSEQARRENLIYLYDGISRNLITFPKQGETLFRPADIRNWGLLEMPPLPMTPPTDAELRKLDYNTCIPTQIKKKQRIHQVLSLEKIGQRRKYFREARLLLFKGSSDKDLKVCFFSIHGRPLPEIDQAFARKNGIQKLNIAKQLADSEVELNKISRNPIVKAGIEIQRNLSNEEIKKLEESARESFIITSKVEENERKLKDPESQAEAEGSMAEIKQLKAEMEKLKSQRMQCPVRRLSVFEHSSVFDQALRDSKTRLLLISPWITDEAMSKYRLEAIHTLLARGVNVYIGYGISDHTEAERRRERDAEDTIAFREMSDLQKRYSNFHLVRFGDTHAKVLLMDSKFAVVGSFNWMSFKGDRKRRLREEYSFMATDPNFVDQQFQDFMYRFQHTTTPANQPTRTMRRR
jgi:hypothetical protein